MKNKEEKIPVEKNMDLSLTIDSLTDDGLGVGRYEEFAVMVPGVIPGEKVKTHIVKVMKNYAIGKFLEIIEKSDMRVLPACPFFGKCGGCQWMHIQYDEQLRLKREIVLSALRRIGHFPEREVPDEMVEKTAGMEEWRHYRNKTQYPVQMENGKIRHGFYSAHSHRLIPIDECLIQSERSNRLIREIIEKAEKLGLPVYDEMTGKGILRHVLIRDDMDTGECSVCLVIAAGKLPKEQEWIRFAKENEITCFSININRQKTNVILGKETRILCGTPYMTARIGDLSYHVSPAAFFQVNSRQTNVLYDLVKEMIDPKPADSVWDIYCGAGTIGLYLAGSVQMVYGVEVVEEAIKNAYENMELNGITNARYFAGKAEEIVPQALKDGLGTDKAVIDPPRSGCDKALLEALLTMAPEKIVYVSCNPATLARDLAVLCPAYRIERVCPVDMFPQTGHVETVALLSRRKDEPRIQVAMTCKSD